MINAFMSKKYTMVIKTRNQKEQFNCQIKVTDLKRINCNKFEVKMKGIDEVGTSKLEGLLVFRKEEMALKLSKVYDDRRKAKQTGEFDVLMFGGVGIPIVLVENGLSMDTNINIHRTTLALGSWLNFDCLLLFIVDFSCHSLPCFRNQLKVFICYLMIIQRK